MSQSKHRLRFINQWNEIYRFVATGATHYSASLEKTLHLIASTVKDPEKSRLFDTKEDAELVLARAGKPTGWDVVAVQ